MMPQIIISALLCTLLSACTSVRVDHEFDPSVDLAQYRSFALLPNPHPGHDQLAARVLGSDDFVLSVAASILEDKGFHRDDGTSADFLLGARVERRISEVARSFDDQGGSGLAMAAWDGARVTRGMGEPISVYTPTPSHGNISGDPSSRFEDKRRVDCYLFLDVFDSKSRKLVWQGWARGASTADFASDSKRASTINRILQYFPN